ncbi:MAG: putative toxin-antitoxin system toxin component, PIN family [Acidovorax sp.]|jgi:predicted nucleic acid-binding protein
MPASQPPLFVPPVAAEGAAVAVTPTLVLDTNVVLGWVVFRDPRCQAWVNAVEGGAVRWVGTAWMREEFGHMLGHSSLAKWSPKLERALTFFDHWCSLQVVPPPCHLRCTDPDDQVFADLAVHAGAKWLLTHDRALLKMRRRLGLKGVAVMPPDHWPAPAMPAS